MLHAPEDVLPEAEMFSQAFSEVAAAEHLRLRRAQYIHVHAPKTLATQVAPRHSTAAWHLAMSIIIFARLYPPPPTTPALTQAELVESCVANPC